MVTTKESWNYLKMQELLGRTKSLILRVEEMQDNHKEFPIVRIGNLLHSIEIVVDEMEKSIKNCDKNGETA